MGRGLFDRARRHLVRAGALSGRTVAFYYDPDAMVVSLDRVRANHDAFLDYLESGARGGPPRRDIEAAQQLFRDLFDAATGDRSLIPERV